MTDWPTTNFFYPDAAGVVSTGTILAGSLSNVAPASTAWPSANLAYFVPFRLRSPVTVCKLAVGAGATAAGNFDVGIYDAQGNKIVASGATAKLSSVEQVIDITDTQIGPGLYYLAMSADGANNYALITPSGTSPVPLQKTRLYGVLCMATAYTLPATATFAAPTLAPFPAISAYLLPY